MGEVIIFDTFSRKWVVLRAPPEESPSSYVFGRYDTYRDACKALNTIVKARPKT
jgi:hypothetical protein